MQILRESSRGEVLNEMTTKINMKPDMTPCDVVAMRKMTPRHRPIMLEGHDLWCGDEVIYDADGRGMGVVSKEVKVWYANGKEIEQDLDNNHMQVCSLPLFSLVFDFRVFTCFLARNLADTNPEILH